MNMVHSLQQSMKGKPRSVRLVCLSVAVIFIAATAHVLLGFLVHFFSPAFELGTEHIAIASAQRVADGLPPVTRPDQLPVTISSFTPFTFILIAPLLTLFGSDQVMAIAIIGRALVLVMILLSIVCLRRILAECFSDIQPRLLSLSLGLYLLLFFVAFPGSLFVFRPDIPATFFELLSFHFFLLHTRRSQTSSTMPSLRKQRESPLGLAALTAATAIAAKQNALGVAVGSLLSLAWRRQPRQLSRYLLILLLSLAAWYGVFQLYLGEALGMTVLGSTASQLVVSNLDGAVDFARRLINELGFKYLPLYLFALYGMVLMWSRHRDLAQATLFCLAASFVFATLGQLKTGAWFNYHYTFFFLAAYPSSLALAHLLRDAWNGRLLSLSMLLGYSLFALLYLGVNLPFPLALARSSYVDYQAVARVLRREFPSGPIYANNSEAIYLHDRILFAPWSEGIIGYTPALAGSLPRLRAEIGRQNFVAALFQASDCKNWKPSGLFEAQLSHLTKFHLSIGNFCIYTTPSIP